MPIGSSQRRAQEYVRKLRAADKSWTVKPGEAPNEWEYHDENRLRAILQYRGRKDPSPWVVHRIGSNGRNHGCDSFRSRAEAHDFITNGRIFK